jgi:HK97 family phage major capsid protein
MTFYALKEARQKLRAKEAELDKVFQEIGPEMDAKKATSLPEEHRKDGAALAAWIRERNDELADLKKDVDDLRVTDEAARASEERRKARRDQVDDLDDDGDDRGGDDRRREVPKQRLSAGKAFTKSDAYQKRVRGGVGPIATVGVDVKTLLRTDTGWTPETTRSGHVEYALTDPLRLTDIVPIGTTNQTAYTWMQEDALVNAATEVDEGGPYPEAELSMHEETEPVRKVGVWIPVTDEQLDDVEGTEDWIDARLRWMVRDRINRQMIVGTGAGTPTQLRGLNNVAGTLTLAVGGDVVLDAWYKAIIKVELEGGADVDALVMNPNDWTPLRLMRTADGVYIWGNPSEMGPERMWGRAVVKERALAAGSGWAGAFAQHSMFLTKKGLEVQATNSHAGYFTEGKMAVRADTRGVFVVVRPPAFCKLTGL